MDIYGYHAYQYNQSDELAKQMFAQQALTSSLPYNRGSEPHSMPPPTGTPWNMQGIAWGLQSPPQLVQFTAHTSGEIKISPMIHCKRKSLDVEPVIPAKQLITEEKMAAHLSGLHISSDYTGHSLANEEVMDVGMTEVQTATLCDRLKGHKIVLSEEIKKIQEEPLLPAALIERLEKPQMSLVVWKPRENILEKIKENEEEKEPKTENGDMNEMETNKQRNGLLVAVQSGMDIEM
ncbi:unnamed protein product [Chilo suppressalis]|uniref:Zasp-like motif domain-containing protein n=1 Tax=Chilo suppressalis TaxID=168631 RepID=A0ABN8B1H9_CHISP|nr:hypothetical protein evm_005109 [Chilo suppressalis]CAH0402785.1 unnamed protein product [Chilo suppressalis]